MPTLLCKTLLWTHWPLSWGLFVVTVAFSNFEYCQKIQKVARPTIQCCAPAAWNEAISLIGFSAMACDLNDELVQQSHELSFTAKKARHKNSAHTLQLILLRNHRHLAS